MAQLVNTNGSVSGRSGKLDYDWLVIGSGFGGSVSALRLSEKGYKVGVLECGRRFEDSDFAETTWQAKKYYWMPKIGLKGIMRMTLLRDVFVVSGCGVGGGSLGYANTLYRALPAFYKDPQWADLNDWESVLKPHYDTAERMLGVTDFTGDGDGDKVIQDLGEFLGVADTYRKTRVGVYFDNSGKTVPDPFFGGEGPDRAGCIKCGSCMVGCRHNAKNTLMKNYLWFAERRGAKIEPERTVVDVKPIGAEDGSEGYTVTSVRSGAWFRKDEKTHTARGVVVAAGPLGTNLLLQNCKHSGSLAKLSDRLGSVVRTNSEAITCVTAKDDVRDFASSVAITSSIYPDENTHIENVTYGRGADSMSMLFALMTGDGNKLTRPVKFLGQAIRHPFNFFRSVWPGKWSRRTLILLVMQTVDSSMKLVPKKKLLGSGVKLQTEQDPLRPNPTFIPVANIAADWVAKAIGGVPQSGITEVLFNTPTTAHILGGTVIANNRDRGVIDDKLQVFGYRNLLVTDGSAISANIGVNPSLTITAQAEHAMTNIQPAPGVTNVQHVGVQSQATNG